MFSFSYFWIFFDVDFYIWYINLCSCMVLFDAIHCISPGRDVSYLASFLIYHTLFIWIDVFQKFILLNFVVLVVNAFCYVCLHYLEHILELII